MRLLMPTTSTIVAVKLQVSCGKIENNSNLVTWEVNDAMNNQPNVLPLLSGIVECALNGESYRNIYLYNETSCVLVEFEISGTNASIGGIQISNYLSASSSPPSSPSHVLHDKRRHVCSMEPIRGLSQRNQLGLIQITPFRQCCSYTR